MGAELTCYRVLFMYVYEFGKCTSLNSIDYRRVEHAPDLPPVCVGRTPSCRMAGEGRPCLLMYVHSHPFQDEYQLLVQYAS